MHTGEIGCGKSREQMQESVPAMKPQARGDLHQPVSEGLAGHAARKAASYRGKPYRSPSLEVPVTWAFSRTELG
jgi:hypothetical protein